MIKSTIALVLTSLLLAACNGASTPSVAATARVAGLATSAAHPLEPVGTLTPASTHLPPPSPLAGKATPPVTPLPSSTAAATLTLRALTPLASPPPECSDFLEGGFLTIWQSDVDLQAWLGCPDSHHPRIVPEAWQVQTAYQPFERGRMIWSDHVGWFPLLVVYVLYADGTYQRFDDTFDPSVDPTSGGEIPPDGLVEPIHGFGKVWREGAGVREALGWATASETSGEGRIQKFQRGEMVWISQTNQTYVFSHNYEYVKGLVHVFDIPFSE